MNASANFQRFMENWLGELRDEMCIPYLHDVIVFSETFSEHVKHVCKAIRRTKSYCVKLHNLENVHCSSVKCPSLEE